MNLCIISYYVFFNKHSGALSILSLPIKLNSLEKLYILPFDKISLISLSGKPLDALPK